MPLGWQKGICLDENGIDQSRGGIDAPNTMKDDECLNWCNEQKLATGCEYKVPDSTCLAHTWSVSSANGNVGSLCSVILPKGLFMKDSNQSFIRHLQK